MREGKYRLRENETMVYKEVGNMPTWAKSPADFWQECDLKEKTVAYREFEVALLNELSDEENIDFVKAYVQEKIGNHPYSFAIHSKPSALDPTERNIHAHIMFYEREIDRTRKEPDREEYYKRHSRKKDGTVTGGYKKNEEFPNAKYLRTVLRKDWTKRLNSLLKEKGFNKEVSDLSIKNQKQRAIDSQNNEKASYFDRKAMPRKTPDFLYKNLQKIKFYRENKEALINEIDLELKEFCIAEQVVYLKKTILAKTVEVNLHPTPKDYDLIRPKAIYKEIEQRIDLVSDQIEQLEKKYSKVKFLNLSSKNLEESIINQLSFGKYNKVGEEIRSKRSLNNYLQKEVSTFSNLHKNNFNDPKIDAEYMALLQKQQEALRSLQEKEKDKAEIRSKYYDSSVPVKAKVLFEKYSSERKELESKLKSSTVELALLHHTKQEFSKYRKTTLSLQKQIEKLPSGGKEQKKISSSIPSTSRIINYAQKFAGTAQQAVQVMGRFIQSENGEKRPIYYHFGKEDPKERDSRHFER